MIKEKEGELVIVSKKESDAIKAEETKVEQETVPTEESKGDEKQTEGITIISASELAEGNVASDDEFPTPPDDYEEVDDDTDGYNYEEESPQGEVKEGIAIVSLDSPSVEQKQVTCPIEAVNNSIKEAGLEQILTDEEEGLVNGLINRTKVAEPTSSSDRVFVNKTEREVVNNMENKAGESQQVEAISLLEKFKSYITSTKFDKKCEAAATKHGVDKKIVKNKFISGFLGTVANTLGLVLTIGSDVIMSATNFIAYIINRIVEFAVDNLKKLIRLLTLNCG